MRVYEYINGSWEANLFLYMKKYCFQYGIVINMFLEWKRPKIFLISVRIVKYIPQNMIMVLFVFVWLCFILVMMEVFMDSSEICSHIAHDYIASIGLRLP